MPRNPQDKARWSDPLTPTKSARQSEAQGWSDIPAAFNAAPRLEATISIRLDADTARIVSRAARLSAQTKSEFIRSSAISAALNKIAQSEEEQGIVFIGPARETIAARTNAKALDERFQSSIEVRVRTSAPAENHGLVLTRED